MRTIFAALFTLLAVNGCSSSRENPPDMVPTGDMAPSPLSGLVSIDVSPATASVAINNGAAAAPIAFTATGHYADNHTADLTSTVSWSLADQTLGAITNGSFTATTTRGGATQVIATASESIVANAALTVNWVTARISTDDSSTAPTTSPTLFAGASTADPTLAPALLYPLDGVTVPNNLGVLEVQWQKPTGAADLFKVEIKGTGFDLSIYTNAMQPAGGRISLSTPEWNAMSASLPGGSATVQVTGMASADPTKSGVATGSTLTIDALALSGGIYYWSPSKNGIERHAFGDTTSAATDFYDESDSGGHCVACHVLSHDGKKAVVSFDGGAPTSALLDVATKTQTIPASAGLHFDFAAFSPDSNSLIAAHQTGTLSIYDTSGGSKQGNSLFDIAPPTSMYYSQPDWSSDGKSIVFISTQATNVTADWQFSGGSIVVMTGPGDGTFANPQIIVQSMGETNYYPSFSPDGKWILFNRATSGVSYNNQAAEVDVVSTDGTSGVIALANTNASGDITNSWPRWSPFVQKYTDGTTRMYFTFSSKRSYGIELQQPAAVGDQRPQVWMASFSPAAATAKMDPSSAPFWLPFQDITTSNHIAQWTTAIVPTIK